MDYAAHYSRLIERARSRVLLGYHERHHVTPLCMGGSVSPDNIVDLTAEEHYVAHQLLVKIHPRNGRLAHAAVWMARRCTGNKAYGWLRKLHAAAVSVTNTGKTPWLGKKHTDEWKAAMSKAMTGRKMSAAGVEKMAASKRGSHHTEEAKKRIGDATRGVPKTAEHRAKISIGHQGLSTITPAGRIAIGQANRARVFSPEIRAKMSASRIAYCQRRAK